MNKVNLISDNGEMLKTEYNSPLPLYEVVKNYYSFWFNYTNPLYYNFSGTSKLYEKITNKYSTPLYTDWLSFINILKEEYQDWTFLNAEDNRPSYTFKMSKKGSEIGNITIYLSMSILGGFYTQIIVKETDIINKVFVSPELEVSEMFLHIENQFKNSFQNYLFISYSMLRMDFFGLIVKGVNEPNREDGLPNKMVTVMEGLFFDFDVFQSNSVCVGDKRYKSEGLSWFFDKKQNDKISEAITCF
jgi:hypothetical protein